MIEKARRAEFPQPRPKAWVEAFAANAACKAAIALHYRKPFFAAIRRFYNAQTIEGTRATGIGHIIHLNAALQAAHTCQL